jgi:hypothetical protein
MFANYGSYTDAESQLWLRLRALEWSGFPAFSSQLIVPVLLIFFPWYDVLLRLVCVDFVWQYLQYTIPFTSVSLSEISCLAVGFLKWPIIIVSSIFLFMNGRYGVGLLALFWPVLCAVVTSPVQILLDAVGRKRSVGSIELALAKRIGYVPQADEL